MAERLIYVYERANQLGGLMARTRLAILTDLPSTQAALSPDSPDLPQRRRGGLSSGAGGARADACRGREGGGQAAG
jgi:hypothetical protein